MSDKIYTIYKATNIVNGKCYIGFDSCWPKRKSSHLREAANANSRTYDSAFHRAIRKYGADSFSVVFKCYSGDFCLNELEPLAILENDSHCVDGYGYNMTYGGDGVVGLRKSDAAKALLRERMLGYKNPFYGKRHTECSLKKMSEASTGKIPTKSNLKKRSISTTKAKSRRWLVTSPSGNQFEIENLKKFCKEFIKSRKYEISCYW